MPFRTGTRYSGRLTLPFSGAALAPRPLQELSGRPTITVPSTGATQQGGVGEATSGLQECQQVGIELVFVRVGETVWATWVDLQGRVLDQLR